MSRDRADTHLHAGPGAGRSGDGPEPTAGPDSFIDKWRARWPEWAVARVFVPHARQPVALAWAALQQELGDAAWGGSDPRPGEAKLGWWQEELLGWAKGLRRHPLGTLLQREHADWARLAMALPALRESRERPSDRAQAYEQLTDFALAVSAIDHALANPHAHTEHAGDGGDPRTVAGALAQAGDAATLAAAQLLHARLLAAGEAAVPLQVLARVGEGDGVAAWAQELIASWPDRSALPRTSRFRAITAALARARLASRRPDRPLSAWNALWTAWKAARN